MTNFKKLDQKDTKTQVNSYLGYKTVSEWIELAQVEQTSMGVLIWEQFTNSCPKDLSIWRKQSNPKILEELLPLADQYLAVHNQKLPSKEGIKRDSTRVVVKDSYSGFPPTSTLECFLCNCIGQQVTDTVMLKQKKSIMSITHQLGTQLHATTVMRLGMGNLEDYWMTPKQRTKNIWSSNLERKKSCA